MTIVMNTVSEHSRLRSETSVNVHVVPADLTEEQDLARVEQLAQAGEGAIVNLASVLGLAPEMGATVYGATNPFRLQHGAHHHG